MSIFKSLKSAAQESHAEGHAKIQQFVKATMLKTEQITKIIAVETIGNALVIVDPITSKIEARLDSWWSGVENAAERFDAAQAMKRIDSTKPVTLIGKH
jgi:hypothetical protein